MRLIVSHKHQIFTEVDDGFVLPENCCLILHSSGYAKIQFNRSLSPVGQHTYIYLHRYILNAPVGADVDHINMNKLDNRLENLRLCDDRQNAHNKISSGVYWNNKGRKWEARCRDGGGRKLYLGRFTDRNHAIATVNAFKIEHRGQFARPYPIGGTA